MGSELSQAKDSRVPLAADDPRHGTQNGYGNLGCRCDDCRRANTAYQKAHKAAGYAADLCACGSSKRVRAKQCRACRDRERAAEHGTPSKYHGGCRCAECRVAANAARQRRREATREATRAWDRAYKARRRGAA